MYVCKYIYKYVIWSLHCKHKVRFTGTLSSTSSRENRPFCSMNQPLANPDNSRTVQQ